MGFLDSWVRQLAAVVLLAGMVEALLPDGAIRGYARALLSLLVLLVVLQPVAGIAQGRLTLTLPSLQGAAPGVGSGGAAATAAVERGAASAYERLVAQGAQVLAAAVPGVLAAEVALSFSPGTGGGLPVLRSVSVAVTPAGGPALDGETAARVRAALAAGLGLAPSEVTVTPA